MLLTVCTILTGDNFGPPPPPKQRYLHDWASQPVIQCLNRSARLLRKSISQGILANYPLIAFDEISVSTKNDFSARREYDDLIQKPLPRFPGRHSV